MAAQAIRLTAVDIENALTHDQLTTVFQPIVSLKEQQLLRHEVFVRWEHPGFGSLPPGAFLSFFENEGRIGDLTRYVLRQALTNFAEAGTDDDTQRGLSLNLTSTDLQDNSLGADLLAILEAHDMRPSQLTLECPLPPQSTFSDDAQTALYQLAELGFALALEIQGRGMPSVGNFTPFPFSELKTGGGQILRYARSSRGGPGLSALSEILQFAQQHGMRTVAVGIEESSTVDALSAIGFDAGQGRALGRANELAEPAVQSAPSGASINVPRRSVHSDADSADANRGKLRVTAAKKAAVRRFQSATPLGLSTLVPAGASADEANAIQRASRTARQLQKRLAQSFPGAPMSDGMQDGSNETGDEAGLAPDHAVSLTKDFTTGLRTDGYTTVQGPRAAGAIVERQLPEDPEARKSLPFGEQEDAAALAAPVAEEPSAEAADTDVEDAPQEPTAVALRAERPKPEDLQDPAEALDALVSSLPEVDDETEDEAVSEALVDEEDDFDAKPVVEEAFPTVGESEDSLIEEIVAAAADPEEERLPAYVSPTQTLVRDSIVPSWLPRNYRITHFWPRSWRRAIRRMKAKQASARSNAAS